jgi:hypothetical protein
MLNYTIFENHSYNDDSTKLFGGTTYVCQTFTSGTAHEIYVVQMDLIRIGACGTVTLGLYDTDTNGKPTGSALATAMVDQSAVGTSAAMVDFTLSPTYIVGNEKLAIVLSADGALGTIGCRYKNVGIYTAGGIFSSTNSGVTWTETLLSDFIFAEWGVVLPVHDATIVQLYPRKEGSYTQLQPATTASNWQQVADPVDSPDEETSYVAFNVADNTGFLTGESDGAAGVVSGTRAFWKSNGSGLWGEGTTFDTELAAGYLLKSPNINEWFAKDWQRVSEISSVGSATEVSLTEACGPLSQNPSTSWFLTPATSSEATAGKVSRMLTYGTEPLPMAYLDGTWTWTHDSKIVSGSGGNAKTIFPDTSVHPYAARGFISSGSSTRINTGQAYPVDTVDTEDQVTLYVTYTGALKEDLTDYTKYAFFGYYDDCTDEDKATMWCTKTKKDSYLVKQTLISGNIRRLDVVFRVCFYNKAFVQEYYPSSLKGDLSTLSEMFNIIRTATSAGVVALYKVYYATYASSLKSELSSLASSYPAIASSVTATNTQIDSTTAIINAFVVTDEKDTIQTSFDAMQASVASTMMLYVDQTGVLPTATAQPFLTLSGTTSLGTEQTLTPITISVIDKNPTPVTPTPQPRRRRKEEEKPAVVSSVKEEDESKWYSFKTYRQTITRPGGGIFTLDDLNNLEVGITLGNISDFTSQTKVICTQIYADLYVSTTPFIKTQLVGMTQYGFKTFANRMDEWALPTFSNGMNMLTHKIYRGSTPFFARPLQILRGITSRILGRRKTSSSPRKIGTSGSITQ